MAHTTNGNQQEEDGPLWEGQRKGLLQARDLPTQARLPCLPAVVAGTPTRSQQSRPCWYHTTLDPATLAMVLASSLYAESSVEELDWPTCWARKQQKRALKMLRPRGFLGEDLETRPRVEGTTEALATGRLSTNTHPRALSPLVYKLHWGTRHVLGEQPNTVSGEMYMFIPTSSL